MSVSTATLDISPTHKLIPEMMSFHPPVRRIAMLSVHTSPLALLGGKKTGGMNVYVRDFSRELGCYNIAIDVFTRSQDEQLPRVQQDLGPGGRVINIPAGPEATIPVAEIGNYLDDFVDGVFAFAEAEGVTYDLIHSHYWLSGLVAEQLQREWQVPIVHMFHTLGHMKNLIAQSDNERAPQERLDGEAHVLQIADRVIAATPAEQQQLIEYYRADPTTLRIIPPGVDPERFHPIDKKAAKQKVGIPCGDANILFVGRIEPLKGVDTLLRAMSILRERHPAQLKGTCLAIIGGDPWNEDRDSEMARLQELRAELNIHNLVTFLGARDQEILPHYYAGAEMVVMPSHYESFGMVALEAMAMGTPVIASEVGGLAHLVQHGVNGFHVPSSDPEALAARILELLTDNELRERLGHQARQYTQRYHWSAIVEQMFDVYQEVLPAA